MIERIDLNDFHKVEITRGRTLADLIGPKGIFGFDLYRGGKLIDKLVVNNAVVDVGKNSWLDVYFRNQTQLPSWYFGLVDNSGFTAFAVTDTMASHAGWTEFTNYDEATRVQWSPAAAASKSISNSTPSTINIAGTGTLKGIFLASNSTKSGTSGTLWTEAAFASTVAVVDNDQLKLTYTVNS